MTQDQPDASKGAMKCSTHNVEMDVESDCETCHGEGVVLDDEGGVEHHVVCWSCRGSGVSRFLDCWQCLEEEPDYL